jgi:hypothetical protein
MNATWKKAVASSSCPPRASTAFWQPPDIRSYQRARPMRRWLPIIGFLAIAIGLLWIGQGTGVIAWPASSFMISQVQWAYYGAALAALGVILIWRSRR